MLVVFVVAPWNLCTESRPGAPCAPCGPCGPGPGRAGRGQRQHVLQRCGFLARRRSHVAGAQRLNTYSEYLYKVGKHEEIPWNVSDVNWWSPDFMIIHWLSVSIDTCFFRVVRSFSSSRPGLSSDQPCWACRSYISDGNIRNADGGLAMFARFNC